MTDLPTVDIVKQLELQTASDPCMTTSSIGNVKIEPAKPDCSECSDNTNSTSEHSANINNKQQDAKLTERTPCATKKESPGEEPPKKRIKIEEDAITFFPTSAGPSASAIKRDLSTDSNQMASEADIDEKRREEKKKRKNEMDEKERQKLQVLVSSFTEDQLNRYEMYRRASFPRAAIKRIMQQITGTTVSQNVIIAMAGIAKVFVGEIVEEGLDVMEKSGESGPLQPKHLREATRRLRQRDMVPNTKYKKQLFHR